jgi:uncharacterized protein
MFSATDVANFLACRHVMTLDRAQAAGQEERPFFNDPGIELLRELGAKHERAYLEHLVGVHNSVVTIPSDIPWDEGAARTVDALRRGTGAIYQGVFRIGPWHGRPDFLVRTEKPSALGAWSYEAIETKLARSTKVGALIQLCFYSDLLSQIQEVQPEWMQVVPGGNTESAKYRVQQYIAYFRKIKQDFDAAQQLGQNTYPEPTEHCNVCSWDPVCDKRRHDDDHLSLVAGITRTQRKALAERDVTSVAALARVDLATLPRMDGVRQPTLVRLLDQAELLVEGRNQGHLIYKILDIETNAGLCELPAPSQWDVFLDLEGDPYVFGHDLEYLMGMLTLPEQAGGQPTYQSIWSFDPSEERESFAKFMEIIMDRLNRYPEMHIYHYASYEPTAIKRLAGRHGLGVDEVDQLLRAEVFVDLYRIVKQGIRASVESYSIKKIEGLYDFQRANPPRVSVLALQTFGAALAMGTAREAAAELLPPLETYNRDDCLSALRLREWLEDRRREIEARNGSRLPRPVPTEREPNEELAEAIQQARAVMARLLHGLPEQESDWTPGHRGRWVMAQMLEYYRREDKSSWWEYFRQCDLSPDELLEDGSALGGLKYVGPVGQVKRSIVHRYSFPLQDHAIDIDRTLDVHDPRTKAGAGRLTLIDDQMGILELTRSTNSTVPHPASLIPYNFLRTNPRRESISRLATSIANHGIDGHGPIQTAKDLLLRQPPRASLPGDESLLDENGQMTEVSKRLVQSLCTQPNVLPLQGPPGSGKTHTGARMIAEVIRNGCRAGITAVSHKVISKLLQDLCDFCRKENLPLRAIQKSNGRDCCADAMVKQADEKEIVATLNARQVEVVAGTAWVWSRADMANAVEVLFVDEAGQMSLCDVLSISQCATSLVLLGDPQQLDQPQKGVHPPGVDMSALAYLLDGQATITNDKGIFLKETYRLHPEICAFTSELFYDNRLMSRPENENQRVCSDGPISGSGLRFFPVTHSGNQIESPEEVNKVDELVKQLLEHDTTWVDKTGQTKKLELKDILIVAPYNAQVSALLKKLPAGARVGTVDKFQGQQAPIVFFSMTTSTSEDAPRGIEFLYSLNRLNVAVSRAQCVAAIVASPALFQVECKSPHQMQLANALCRYYEMAQSIGQSHVSA